MALWGLLTYDRISANGRRAIFAIIIALACVEKPCSVLNTVAVERDWVVVIAGENKTGLQGASNFRNAVFRMDSKSTNLERKFSMLACAESIWFASCVAPYSSL